MDPRRPNDPRKRGPSRSPEGGQSRKQQRSDEMRDHESDSRRSSLSNDRAGPPAAQSPKPPGQGTGMRRRPSDAPVSSPRSPRDTITSGRSTPQQMPSVLSKSITQQSNGLFVAKDMPSDPTSLVNLLTQLGDGLASRAAMETQKASAERQYTNAQREYNEMKKYFGAYPAIRDRKTADKNTAWKVFKAKEKLCDEHKLSEQTVVQSLASALGQVNTPQQHNDIANRAEFDALQNLVATQEDHIHRIQADNRALQDEISKLHESKVQPLDARLTLLANQTNETKQAMEGLKEKELSKLATKEDFANLKANYDRVDQKVGELQKARAAATAEKIQISAETQAGGTKSQGPEYPSELQIQIDSLRQGGEERLKQSEIKMDEMVKSLNELGEDMVDSKQRIETLEENTDEAGKEPLVKRVKNLDVLVNKLSTTVIDEGKPPLVHRIGKLEKEYETLRTKVQTTERDLQGAVPAETSASADLKPLEARISQVADELGAFASQQEERDSMVETEVENVRREVSEKMQEADAAFQKFSQELEGMQAALQGMKTSISTHPAEDSVESIKNEVSVLLEQVKKLQASADQQKSRPTSKSPPQEQFYTRAQQMPNGVAGSPSLPQQQVPSSDLAEGLRVAQQNIDMLIGVTQNLKARADNLQTDDIVRNMLDQMSSMYPDAKNVNNSLQHIRNGLVSLEQKVLSIEQQPSPSMAQFQEEVKRAAAKADSASNQSHNLFQETQKIWTAVNSAKSEIEALETEARKTKDASNSRQATPQRSNVPDARVSQEITYIREELTKLEKAATEANTLSKHHSSRFKKIEEKITAVENKVQEHDSKMSEGETVLQDSSVVTAKLQGRLDAVEKTITSVNGKVSKLEDKMAE